MTPAPPNVPSFHHSIIPLSRSSCRNRPAPGRRGVALVWTALVLLVVVGIVGLSLDWGKVTLNVHELHNAADAGALAGALVVKADPARARSLAISVAFGNEAEGLPVTVADNPSNVSEGEVVLGRWIRQERQFIETDVAPNAVKVVGSRLGQRADAPQLSLTFGPVFDVDSMGVSRHAIAWSLGSTGSGILCLAEDPSTYPGWNHPTGLLMDGGTTLDLRGVDPVTKAPMIGDIQVNSSATSSPWAAFRLDGTSADIWAGEFNVAGTTNPAADNTAAWQNLYADTGNRFSVNPGSDPVEDPLATVAAPNIDAMAIPLDKNGAPYTYTIDNQKIENLGTAGVLALSPGYYPGGIAMSKSGLTIRLTGGADAVYAFGGSTDGKSGLVVTGGTFIANGVMCYVTGDPDGSHPGTDAIAYGKIDIGGNAEVQLSSRGDEMSPPQIGGELGIAIWQDRDNPSYGRIIGNGNIDIDGTIYCGYNPMEVGGAADQTGSQLIAGALYLHGSVSLGIAYDGRNTILAYRSILVE